MSKSSEECDKCGQPVYVPTGADHHDYSEAWKNHKCPQDTAVRERTTRRGGKEILVGLCVFLMIAFAIYLVVHGSCGR